MYVPLTSSYRWYRRKHRVSIFGMKGVYYRGAKLANTVRRNWYHCHIWGTIHLYWGTISAWWIAWTPTRYIFSKKAPCPASQYLSVYSYEKNRCKHNTHRFFGNYASPWMRTSHLAHARHSSLWIIMARCVCLRKERLRAQIFAPYFEYFQPRS